MPAEITILGIRHHGPGSARMVVSALKKLKPEAVLIEGPPDAHEVLSLAAHSEMKPPVALLVYEPDSPASAAYYPFAEFSPEWQAIRWGLGNKAEVRFVDLPWANRKGMEEEKEGETKEEDVEEGEGTEETSPGKAMPHSAMPRPAMPRDPLELLAQAAGFEDGEAWWGRLIEERAQGEDPHEVFGAIIEAMAAARPADERDERDPDNGVREAHMRRAIRAAAKEGYGKIAVVCGAYHAPALTPESIERIGAKADDALLKGLPKRKTVATWIPWTYDRLSMWSGYGAGVHSPGWYHHLWKHPEEVVERWMTRVARLLREEDLDASPAHIIEAARLARTLASLRGRVLVGLTELTEATLSVLCGGNTLPLKVIERKLIVGVRLGETPEETPVVPLQRDLTAQQRTLRMKPSADDTVLDLDQRKEIDLARSRLLHRLCILKIEWGKLQDDSRRAKGTFHEVWKLQWAPEFSVKVVEAARWGNTVAEAAGAFVGSRVAGASMLSDLTAMLDDVMLADLPESVGRLVERIQELSAVSADFGNLLEALPPLAGVMRYGNVRKTDVLMVEPVVVGMVARIGAGLLPACASLDDEAAELMLRRIDSVEASLSTLERADLLEPWREALRKLSDASVHGLLAGRATRLLLDGGGLDADAAATRLSLSLSAGNDPAAAAAWLEGFLGGSGLLLVHDGRLLGMVDEWVCGLTRELFERVCPIVRRTFSAFERTDRRMIGEKLRGLERGTAAAPATSADGEDYDGARAELVMPVLRLILGEPL